MIITQNIINSIFFIISILLISVIYLTYKVNKQQNIIEKFTDSSDIEKLIDDKFKEKFTGLAESITNLGTIAESLQKDDTYIMPGNLVVTKLTVKDELSVGGNTNLNNNLNVKGNTVLGSNLSVEGTGNTKLTNNLEVIGDINLHDNLIVSGNINMKPGTTNLNKDNNSINKPGFIQWVKDDGGLVSTIKARDDGQLDINYLNDEEVNKAPANSILNNYINSSDIFTHSVYIEQRPDYTDITKKGLYFKLKDQAVKGIYDLLKNQDGYTLLKNIVAINAEY